MSSSPASPAWMRTMLLVAGAYNIVWGAWVVFFPAALFAWLGMAPPNYPALWQCIGMIVGVYGVGYAIAAIDPARHWPVVLVGLLGKVFGPVGMIHAVWTGALPPGFALTCVTNDVIWWIPFGLILKFAWTSFQNEFEGGPLPEESVLLEQTLSTTGRSLASLSQEKPLMLVFLRHSGCTFCRQALADIAAQRKEIEATGVGVVLVHMGAAESFARFAGNYGLSDLPAVADSGRRLYRGLGLHRGTLSQLLGWEVWRDGARSFFTGHRVGKVEGDIAQMPGIMLVHEGRVVRRYHHARTSDRPDYLELCKKHW